MCPTFKRAFNDHCMKDYAGGRRMTAVADQKSMRVMSALSYNLAQNVPHRAAVVIKKHCDSFLPLQSPTHRSLSELLCKGAIIRWQTTKTLDSYSTASSVPQKFMVSVGTGI